MTNRPKLACPNFYSDVPKLKSFALDCGFQGIDWTLRPEDLPKNALEEKRLANSLSRLSPLEVRFHLFFPGKELGDADPQKAHSAKNTFCAAFDFISEVSGRFATVHVGLGRDSMEGISWEATIDGLTDVAARARQLGIRICLENLVKGWTGKPDLYEELIRNTGCWGTLDIGHARVCRSVADKSHEVEDFVLPHSARILSTHVYHEETEAGHVPPADYSDLVDRLRLLRRLPLCDWWVLELREETALLQTLDYVSDFLSERIACPAV